MHELAGDLTRFLQVIFFPWVLLWKAAGATLTTDMLMWAYDSGFGMDRLEFLWHMLFVLPPTPLFIKLYKLAWELFTN